MQIQSHGATFDEVLFADNTICVCDDKKTMNKMLAAIEKVVSKSCMKLNRGRCESLQFGGVAK